MSTRSSYWLIATCMLLCAATIFAALIATSTALRAALASIGVLGFIAVYNWSRQISARAILDKQQRDNARFEELKREFAVLGTPLEVKGSTGVNLSLFLIVSAAGTVYFAWNQRDIEAIILACMMVPIAFFLTLATVPLIGKPVITIRRDGVDTPAYGLIAWHEIDHISLQALNSKGPPVPHVLRFTIPALAERISQAHPIMRLLYRMRPHARRTLVILRLTSTTESPSVIHELCLYLWAKAAERRTPSC